jgi:hypothetical protein
MSLCSLLLIEFYKTVLFRKKKNLLIKAIVFIEVLHHLPMWLHFPKLLFLSFNPFNSHRLRAARYQCGFIYAVDFGHLR